MNKKLNLKKWGYLILLFSVLGQAQITKGNWMVGGNAFFDNTNLKESSGKESQSSTQIFIQPNIGYFIYDKFSTGLSTRFGYAKTNGNSSSSSGFGFGPFVRYYFLKPEKTINILIEVNYSYSKDINSSNYNKGYGFKAGPEIFFNSSVGLELLVKYEHAFYSSDSFTTNSFQIGLGLQIYLENNK